MTPRNLFVTARPGVACAFALSPKRADGALDVTSVRSVAEAGKYA
jgi:hypothetical protein